MNTVQTLESIKAAINSAPRNDYVAELHLQIIKHADALQNMTGRDFCSSLGIKPSYAIEFAKMRKIAPRLIKAELNPNRI